MDISTGKLYEDYEDGEKDILNSLQDKEDDEKIKELEKRLMPLDAEEFKELKTMNRAERRRWAREHKRKDTTNAK